MVFVSKKVLEELREEFPKGTRVELGWMDDLQAPPLGTQGTVEYVDDTGTIHVAWDNGSHLGAVYGEDSVSKVS